MRAKLNEAGRCRNLAITGQHVVCTRKARLHTYAHARVHLHCIYIALRCISMVPRNCIHLKLPDSAYLLAKQCLLKRLSSACNIKVCPQVQYTQDNLLSSKIRSMGFSPCGQSEQGEGEPKFHKVPRSAPQALGGPWMYQFCCALTSCGLSARLRRVGSALTEVQPGARGGHF